jgi:DNA-binding CsgD family transcriptional regulator
MSITIDGIAKANGVEGRHNSPDTVNLYLFEALGGALDSLVIGVILVGDRGRILHANLAAQWMIEARSPILSLGGCLCALQAERTKQLRLAIVAAQTEREAIGAGGIGVPLLDKMGVPATAHIVPLISKRRHIGHCKASMPVGVFVTPVNAAPPVDVGTVAQSFNLTRAEVRLLQQLISGASLHEAAVALGVADATARTHRNHLFTKTGVSRRSDLLLLVGRLVPPIRCMTDPVSPASVPSQSSRPNGVGRMA